MVPKKTEEKRLKEYAALKILVDRMNIIGREITKLLMEQPEIKEAGLTERDVELLLRIPCVYCDKLGSCSPDSRIISIFSCSVMDITAVHHRDAIRKSQEWLRAGVVGITDKEIEDFIKELSTIRFPGRLRVIYNEREE